MTDVLMPALSPTMEEGVLAKWLVKVGDNVKSGDVIAEIETDKATMEVEAVDEGVVEALLVTEGTEGVKVNAPIARLSGGDVATLPPSPGEKEPAATSPALFGTGEEKIVSSSPAPLRGGGGGSPSRELTEGANRIAASPLARRIAAQKGIDLSMLKGSGPHGRIIERDLDGAKTSAPTTAKSSGPDAPVRLAQSLEQMGIAPGSYDLTPLDGMRKTVARRLTDSFRDVPHFPLGIDLEIDNLLAARIAINAALEASGVKVSVNDLVIKAAAMALRAVPDANASYSPEGIARHHHADVAVAVAIDGGLITPIIRAAETKGVAQIAMEMKDLAARAPARKLKPEVFQGGTFSVSNLGMFGIKSFASIINEPQGAILSVGAGEKRPVVRGDALAIATVMSVTLTCDHRVVDGAIGARWLRAFKGMIDNPVVMLA